MRAVIFDMDGVLVDSQPYHFKADRDTMIKYGVYKDEKFYESFAGTVTLDRMNTLKNMFHIQASAEEMADVREKMILDIIENEDIKPVNGIPELLRSIKSKGLKTAVASSSGYELINMVLEKLDIAKYFDCITSGVDVKRGKPIFKMTSSVPSMILSMAFSSIGSSIFSTFLRRKYSALSGSYSVRARL